MIPKGLFIYGDRCNALCPWLRSVLLWVRVASHNLAHQYACARLRKVKLDCFKVFRLVSLTEPISLSKARRSFSTRACAAVWLRVWYQFQTGGAARVTALATNANCEKSTTNLVWFTTADIPVVRVLYEGKNAISSSGRHHRAIRGVKEQKHTRGRLWMKLWGGS